MGEWALERRGSAKAKKRTRQIGARIWGWVKKTTKLKNIKVIPQRTKMKIRRSDQNKKKTNRMSPRKESPRKIGSGWGTH